VTKRRVVRGGWRGRNMSTTPQHCCASKSFTRAHPSNEAERQMREVQTFLHGFSSPQAIHMPVTSPAYPPVGLPSFLVQSITNRMSNVCRTLTTNNTTEKQSVNSHTHNATALQPNVFQTALHRLPATRTYRNYVHLQNHCQGQRHSPERTQHLLS
jgi:hypothetical protein